MMFLWCFVFFVVVVCYFAFFWKFNYVKDFKPSKRASVRKIGELPPVYPNGWFRLLESADLKNGQVKHISALGENFAVFRTESGVVNIIDAYCPHLGANLAEGGRVKGECVQCPFHDWTFSGDGKCQSIPYAKIVPAGIKTKAWKVCEVNQTVFVWYHAESIEPDWQPEAIPPVADGSWSYHGRNEFLVNCHIQEIPENGADWAHLSAVHGPPMLSSIISPKLVHHSWTGAVWSTQSSLDSAINDGNKSDHKHRALLNLHHSIVILEKYPMMQLDVTAEQIGPGYVQLFLKSALGTMCILQCVTPVEPLLQRVTHVIFAPRLISPLAKIVLFGESLMFERDIAVWNHKKFRKNPVLVREDRSILAFRRWYSQFYSPHSPTYQSTTSLEW